MINPDELRLGNLFILPNGNIGKITYHEIRLLIVGNPKPDYKPIELTEEWLIKFGFEKATHEGNDVMICNKSEWNFVLEYYNFPVKNESSWFLVQYLGQLEIKIQFTYQLQNLYFALTNKELTIK